MERGFGESVRKESVERVHGKRVWIETICRECMERLYGNSIWKESLEMVWKEGIREDREDFSLEILGQRPNL
jgi:hypothetical protein